MRPCYRNLPFGGSWRRAVTGLTSGRPAPRGRCSGARTHCKHSSTQTRLHCYNNRRTPAYTAQLQWRPHQESAAAAVQTKTHHTTHLTSDLLTRRQNQQMASEPAPGRSLLLPHCLVEGVPWTAQVGKRASSAMKVHSQLTGKLKPVYAGPVQRHVNAPMSHLGKTLRDWRRCLPMLCCVTQRGSQYSKAVLLYTQRWHPTRWTHVYNTRPHTTAIIINHPTSRDRNRPLWHSRSSSSTVY